jgi:hypothetical protein
VSFLADFGPIILCGILSIGAFAQSAPPSCPSRSVNIHQVEIAFIGSGAGGVGTFYFHGRSYPFKLGGLGDRRDRGIDADATGSVYDLLSIAPPGTARTGITTTSRKLEPHWI